MKFENSEVFSNTERPYSCPQGPTSRPFSSSIVPGGLNKFQKTKILSRAGMQTVSSAALAPIPEDPTKAMTEAGDATKQPLLKGDGGVAD